MPVSLNARQRARLKALAHPLAPIIQIGKTGLQEPVIAELDKALNAHGLIKVKINDPDRDSREALTQALATATDAAIVQRVGKVVVLWRPKPEDRARAEADAD